MADEAEKKDLADGSRPVAPNTAPVLPAQQPEALLPVHENIVVPPQAPSPAPVPVVSPMKVPPPLSSVPTPPPKAVHVAPIDDLLAPSAETRTPSNVLPPISVMPKSATSANPLPQPSVQPLPSPKTADPTPIPKVPEPPIAWVRKTTQPTPATESQSATTPQVNPPLSERITPAPPKPLIPTMTVPESVILSETVRVAEKPIPTASVSPVAVRSEQAVPTPPTALVPPEPAQVSIPKKPWGPFSDNISNILSAIKLPERFEAKASGDRPHQEAPEPTIISETVTPRLKADPPQADTARAPVSPGPLHFAKEMPPVVPVAPSQAPKPTPVVSHTESVPDVGLPSHPVSTFAAMPSAAPVSTNSPQATVETPIVNPAASISTAGENAAKEKAEDHSIVTPMRTFKEDLMHVVHDRKISLISAVAMEEDKKREVRQPSPAEIAITRQKRRRAFAILYTVAILFGLSVAALYGVYTVQNQHAIPASNPNSTSIIFAEQTFSFPLQDLTSNDIKRTLSQSRGSSNASLGSITRIVPTVKTEDGAGARAATTAEFFRALDLNVTDDLVRALSSEFFFGIHTIDKNSAVMIIPVYSYERAFAGMLEWEPAMNTDLAPAFTAVPSFTTDENGLPQRRLFEDIVMRNYDTRVLKDDFGAIQMYYSFPTPNILILSENPFSFTEILSRLQVQRRL